MLILFSCLQDSFRARAVLQAEILALRQQLLVLQRSSHGKKLRLRWADRVLLVWISQLWHNWRSALLIVKPETVIAWHRKGFRFYWSWKSRRLEGRPTVRPEICVVDLYESCRTHLSLEKDAPICRPIEPPTVGPVIEIPKVGGLHHLYTRKAA